MAEDLDDAIRTNAEGPAEAHGDSGGMRQHSLTDQIAADKYLAGKQAMARPIGARCIRAACRRPRAPAARRRALPSPQPASPNPCENATQTHEACACCVSGVRECQGPNPYESPD